MNNWIKKAISQVPSLVLSNRILFWLLFVSVTAAAVFGAQRFSLELASDSILVDGDPVQEIYQNYLSTFDRKNNTLYVVYRPSDGDVFSYKSLKTIQAVTNGLNELKNNRVEAGDEQATYIQDVVSITNAPYTGVTDDSVFTSDFADVIPSDQAGLQRLKQRALAYKQYPLTYFSKDTQFGAFVIEFETGFVPVDNIASEQLGLDTDIFIDEIFQEVTQSSVVEEKTGLDGLNESVEFVDFIEGYLSQKAFEDLEFYPVGNAVIEQYIGKEIIPNAINIALITLALTVLISSLLLKSQSSVLWSNTIVLVTCIWLLGVIGYTGLEVGFMGSMVFTFIVTIGIADSIHILSGYQFYSERGYSHREAIKHTYEKTAIAIFYTTATTVAGMLVLVFVPIKAIQVFGIATAIGVSIAFLLTIFMLPLMLDLWRPKFKNLLLSQGQEKQVINSWYSLLLSKFEKVVRIKPIYSLLVFAALLVAMIIGTSLAKVDYHVLDGFDSESSIVKAFNIMDEKLSGTTNLTIFINTGKEDSLKSDAKLISAIDQMQNDLVHAFGAQLVGATSITDTVKQFQLLVSNENNETLPETDYQLGQLMFFLTSTNPEEISSLVTKDFDKTHISLNFRSTSLSEFEKVRMTVNNQIEIFLDKVKTNYPQAEVFLTGGAAVENQVIKHISESQIQGILTATVIISLILFLIFASVKYALIAFFVNIVPLSLVSGLMGFMDIPIGVYTLIVMPLILGIVVDDTIHFITHYREEVAKGKSTDQAIYVMLSEAGQAVTFTTLILLASFVPIIFIEHQEVSNIGFLSSLALSIALLAEFLLLPAMLKIFANTDPKNLTSAGYLT